MFEQQTGRVLDPSAFACADRTDTATPPDPFNDTAALLLLGAAALCLWLWMGGWP